MKVHLYLDVGIASVEEAEDGTWEGFVAAQTVDMPIPPTVGMEIMAPEWPSSDYLTVTKIAVYLNGSADYTQGEPVTVEACCCIIDSVSYKTFEEVKVAYADAGWHFEDVREEDNPLVLVDCDGEADGWEYEEDV